MNKIILFFFISSFVYSQGYDFVYSITPNSRVILYGNVEEIISHNEFVFSDTSGFCLVNLGATYISDLGLEKGDSVEVYARSHESWNIESKRTVFALEVKINNEAYEITQVRFYNDY